jgi:cathepsin B
MPAMDIDMVNTINKVQTSWTAHMSPRFANATIADVVSLCGSKLSTDEGFDASLPVLESYKTVGLPESFDSTTDFPGCEDIIGHVRDQSSCGSCWAFGSTEAFNDRRCVAYGDKTWYSTEDTLACCSGIKCGMSMGCNGGQPTSAWKFFASTGVTTGGDFTLMGTGETCNPYPFAACAHHVDPTDEYPECPEDDYHTPKCTMECEDAGYKTAYADDKVKAKSAFTVKGEEDMMTEIVTNGPVTAAFTVYDDFPAYQSGVYVHTSNKQLGGHAIEIVGFGVEDGQKYWKVKNSWNPSWGDGGFFKILRGTNECGIEGTVSAGLV